MWITVRAELVAELLRPGNAGLNTAADHVVVLDPQPLLRWINRFRTVWWIRRLRRCRHRESGAVTKASKLFSVAPAETDGTGGRAIRAISGNSPIGRGWVRGRAGLTHSDVHRLQAAVGNRATGALLGPNVPVQRAMYLENQDDLIYKDSNNAHAEYAFVHKSGGGQAFYLDYDKVRSLQGALGTLSWPNERRRQAWFDDLVPNAGRGDQRAQTVLNALGSVWAEIGGVLSNVRAALQPVVIGHLAQIAVTRGPQYNNVGGGSRLPRGEGIMVVRNDVDPGLLMARLGADQADLAMVQVHRASPMVMGSVAPELRGDPQYTNVLELKFDPTAALPDIVYGSKVQARRSANARVLCAGVHYREDFSDLHPSRVAAVTATFNALPAATASSGWIPGTNLVPFGRGQGQAAAMNDWNARGAAAFANRYAGAAFNLDQNWEWLHIRGAQIGGVTTAGNLVAGLYATNSMMIPYETLVAGWARQGPHTFWAKFDAVPTNPGFASRMSISIRAQQGHPVLGSVEFDPLIVFDPIAGAVVDKIASEMIKRHYDRTRRVS